MRVLEKRGIEFEKIYVDTLPERRAEMVKLSGRTTVPQIFIGDTHVGGYHELARLDLAGGLDSLAQPAQSP
jgi:glutaredoxin 3